MKFKRKQGYNEKIQKIQSNTEMSFWFSYSRNVKSKKNTSWWC